MTMPNKPVGKPIFRPLNLFFASSIIGLYTWLFQLQEDMVSVIVLSIVMVIIFPIFEFEEEKKKT